MKKFNKPTTLRTHFKKLVNDLNDNFRGIGEEFDGVHQRIDEFNQFKKEFYELRDEIASNGVATSINKLNAEVFNDKKEVETPFKGARSFAHMLLGDYDVTEVSEEATLAGKVDAIIEHLGLDVTVKPQEIKEAKVTAKTVSTKKKGRR